MAAKKSQGRAVLVTTAHRGVFFGYLVGEISKEKVTLDRMRNIPRWNEETRGFVGLASTGPTDGCRVGPPADDASVLFDITSVVACTPEAVQRWETGPWAL